MQTNDCLLSDVWSTCDVDGTLIVDPGDHNGPMALRRLTENQIILYIIKYFDFQSSNSRIFNHTVLHLVMHLERENITLYTQNVVFYDVLLHF